MSNTRAAGYQPAPPVLANGRVEYPALTVPHDPYEFYQTREGLTVWPEFSWCILAAVKPVAMLDAKTGSFREFRQNLSNTQITGELPEGYEWNRSELCARLAQMITKQWGGKEGELSKRYVNLFYVPKSATHAVWCVTAGGLSCIPKSVVHVHWDDVECAWFVNAWERARHHSALHPRVFLRN